MTAEPDLLPELVAEGLDFFNLAGDEGDKLYVRAIRQHIAAKDAEIEALRAEVATWEGLHASEVQVRQRWQARAERLAEALETCLEVEERPSIIEMARVALRDHDQEGK